MAVWEEAGLRAKIDPDTGPELVIYKEDGLPHEQTIRMQIGMLENNSLSGTLSFRCEAQDGAIAFRYSISGMRRLRFALGAAPLREEQWDGLLAAIALALREGADYLVRETEYVLDPDWIWVRRDVRDVRLAAVPIVGFGSPERAWKQWKSLYDCLVEHGLPERWRDRLRPSQWEASTFSHRLWMEAEDGRPENEGSVERYGAFREEGVSTKASFVRAERAIQGNSVIGKDVRAADDGETMRFTAPRISRNEWVRLLVATVCCIFFVWNPSLPALLVACLGCIPLGVTLYRRYGKEGGETTGTAEHGEVRELPFEAAALETSAGVEVGASVGAAVGAEPAPMANRTLLLSHAQETVLLSEMKPERSSELEIAFEESDRIEIVPLTNGPLRLGRGPAGVDVVVDHAAASRVHLEFDIEDGRPRACDLGSTNGTYYMDRTMSPHERYELRDGDLLRLPGAVVRVIVRGHG